jgi:hypothetical protein
MFSFITGFVDTGGNFYFQISPRIFVKIRKRPELDSQGLGGNGFIKRTWNRKSRDRLLLKIPSGQICKIGLKVVPLQRPCFFRYLEVVKGNQSSFLLYTKIPLITSYFRGRLVWKRLCLFDEKKSAYSKCRARRLLNRLEDPNRPLNIKRMVPAIFGDRFVEILEGGLSTCRPSFEELGD